MAAGVNAINPTAKSGLFNLMAGFALLLCVTTGGLWIASYSRTIGWRSFSQDNFHSWTTDIETVKGGIQFRQDIRSPYPFLVRGGFKDFPVSYPPWTKGTCLGFGRDRFTYKWNNSFTATRIVIAAPWYPFVFATGIAAYALLAKVWRNRRDQHAQGFEPIIPK